jgi:hypothetical protein
MVINDFYPGVCTGIIACRDIWSENLSPKSETNNGGNRRDMMSTQSLSIVFVCAVRHEANLVHRVFPLGEQRPW